MDESLKILHWQDSLFGHELINKYGAKDSEKFLASLASRLRCRTLVIFSRDTDVHDIDMLFY